MKEIYLDAHATTKVDPIVLEAMMPYFTEYYGNGNHRNGWKADKAVEMARMQVAHSIGTYPKEIYFTSGATEAINTGIIGLAKFSPNKKHIITQVTEHPAVLRTIEHLENHGYSVTFLRVDCKGEIGLDELRQSITDETLMVAIMLSNNEIGTIHPMEAIGKICKDKGVFFFCDMTQGVGWYDVDVHKYNIDMACISAHKIYGPRGVGALYCRIPIQPLMHGGGQERGIRAGTVNVPGVVGFGKACSLSSENRHRDLAHIENLRDHLLKTLFKNIEGIHINGTLKKRHPGNINIRIDGIRSEQLMMKVPNLVFSNSSACSRGNKVSHVLTAIGLSEKQCTESIRIGISKYNTIDEVQLATEQIMSAAETIRKTGKY